MKKNNGLRARFPYWHEATLFALLFALLVVVRFVDPVFTKLSTQSQLSLHVWELAILSLPMTLLIITGGIDLSIGSVMALSAVTLGLAYEAHWPLSACALLAVAAGLLAGLLNGFFIACLRVHPLIVTLATLSAFQGAAIGVSQARPFSGFPEHFARLSHGFIAGVPVPGVLFAVLAVLTAVALAKSRLGRSLFAMGHNETAARFSGIPVDRIKLFLYALSGAAAGLMAVFHVSLRNTAKADMGTGMELDVITAVILGGTSIFGGRGNVAGTILGVLLIHETREFVGWRWNQSELNLIVVGMLLIASVLLNRALAPQAREPS